MATQLLLEMPNMHYDILSFDDSQRAVYEAPANVPLFLGNGNLRVNMDWVLHSLNFFRHHMIKEEAHSLFHTMEALSVDEKPSAWREPLQTGSYALGRHWKGTYSYLDPAELRKIRKISKNIKKGKPSDEVFFEDKNIELGGKIQVSYACYIGKC